MTLFGTAGIRGPVSDVTPELALSVGRAVGREAAEVVVGFDGRETSETLADAVAAGLTSGGADVVRGGRLPTSALAYASQGRHGVMVTASHNPPTDNGLKLFADGCEYGSEAEGRVESRVADDAGPVQWNRWGESERESPLMAYRSAVVSFARDHGSDPTALTVAVDCGNGMGSLVTPQVLRELGTDVRALNANVDGHFPGRGSKPTPETLTDLRAFVAQRDIVGIGHDGDADRIVVVDDDGEIVHEDTVLAILAEHYVERSDAADPVVVTTPNASGRIDERVRAAGGRVERTGLGTLHEELARIREDDSDATVVFAAEPWKHLHPEFGGWIDAIVSAAIFVRLVAADGLDRLRAPVTERPYRKVSITCPDERKTAVMARLEDELPNAFPEATVDTEHGVRLDIPDDGWTLVRPSGTEPYIRLYAESDDVDSLVDIVSERIEAAVEEQ
jgi:phosphomannomutase